jgi:hypothetical protein
VSEYRLFADGRPNGRARVTETSSDAGVRIDFDAALGAPHPERALAGTLFLDDGLRWQRLEIENGSGRRQSFDLDPDVELEIEGVPALYGVTTRRLVRGGATPARRSEVQVLRLDASLAESRRRAAYLWVSGQSWRYVSGRDAAWLSVRPADGVVRSVEGEAELVE